jgi:hypothetical protein
MVFAMVVQRLFRPGRKKEGFDMRIIKDLLTAIPLCLLVIVPGAQSLAAGEASRDEPVDVEQLKRDWSVALDSLMEYSSEQRDAAVEEAGETLAQMDQQIELLEEKTTSEWEEMSVEAREARVKAMRELQRKRNELAEWYGGLKHSSTQAWAEVKAGFVDAYRSLEEAWQDAADEFE